MGQGSSATTSSSSVHAYATASVRLVSDQVRAGGAVEGVVVLKLAKPVEISEVLVALSSSSKLVRGLSFYDDEMLNMVTKLASFNNGTKLLPEAQHSFSFRLVLPRHAPPSLDFDMIPSNGNLEYKLSCIMAYRVEVKVAAPGWFSRPKTLASFPVQVLPEIREPARSYGQVKMDLDWGFLLFRSYGRIEVDVVTDKRQLEPGTSLQVSVYLGNQSNCQFDLGSVKLVRNITQKGKKLPKAEEKWSLAPMDSETSFETFAEVVCAEDKSIPPPAPELRHRKCFGSPFSKTCLKVRVTIPMNLRHQSTKTRRFAAEYLLAVKLVPRSIFGQNAEAKVPLKIGFTKASEDHGSTGTIPTATPVEHLMAAEIVDVVKS